MKLRALTDEELFYVRQIKKKRIMFYFGKFEVVGYACILLAFVLGIRIISLILDYENGKEDDKDGRKKMHVSVGRCL